MKRIYDPQIDKYHNRVEEGDVVHIVVDDETAARIVAEDAAEREKEIKLAAAEAEKYQAYMPIVQGMKAPRDWHEANFTFGKDHPNAKEINSRKLVENLETGEMEEIKSEAGTRGAVASGKRQPDGSIVWDWNYEEDEVYNKNLLDFYVLPDYSELEFPKGDTPKYQHLDAMPKEEKENPLMVWADQPEPTKQEWRDLTAKAARNMRTAGESYEFIKSFINGRKTEV